MIFKSHVSLLSIQTMYSYLECKTTQYINSTQYEVNKEKLHIADKHTNDYRRSTVKQMIVYK